LTVSWSDFAGDATSAVFDSAADQTSETDANNHTTTFQEDADDDLTVTTSPMGRTDTVTQRDLDGNVLAETNPAGKLIKYGYDVMNPLVQTTDAIGLSNSTRL